MKLTKSIAPLAALLSLGFGAGRAFAQMQTEPQTPAPAQTPPAQAQPQTLMPAKTQTYDNSLRLGIYIIKYDVKASDISGPFVPPGTNLDVKDTNTLYISYVRRINKDFDVEFAFGNPPKTETVGKGPAMLGSAPYDGQVIATAKWLSPSLLLQYKFLEESSPWRPYVGLGVNFTHFYDIQSTAAGNAATGGPTTLKLTNSFGPAFNVGIAYRVDGPWHVYASYNYAKVKSDLTTTTAGVVRTSTINFNPSAIVLSVGYSFSDW
jgi:outer membrane protein